MPITQSTVVPLEHGQFSISYHTIGSEYCITVSHGKLAQATPIVRLHSSCLFSEAFQGMLCDCAAQLSSTLKLIKKNKSGVVVYRFMEGRGVGLETKIKALELQRTRRINTIEAFQALGFEPDLRTYEIEIAALKELGVSTRIKVAGQNPNKLRALEEAGFTLVDQVHPRIKVTKHNLDELIAKRDILGYNINIDLLHQRIATIFDRFIHLK